METTEHKGGEEDKQATSTNDVGWSGMLVSQYRKIKENAETYPYVWGSYIVRVMNCSNSANFTKYVSFAREKMCRCWGGRSCVVVGGGRSCVASVVGEDVVGNLGRRWPSLSASREEDVVVSVIVKLLCSESPS
ncbi:hypothetical protein F8388_004956 [Cannabis sativa]|uniref:Uncharacterized protein n=1 Tax=Cannabis sativa TaxID=3483 RepID=A0A7J6HQI4_CANSA|nr:hypothetical protein F8388_004956 [Cannabis sativa]